MQKNVSAKILVFLTILIIGAVTSWSSSEAAIILEYDIYSLPQGYVGDLAPTYHNGSENMIAASNLTSTHYSRQAPEPSLFTVSGWYQKNPEQSLKFSVSAKEGYQVKITQLSYYVMSGYGGKNGPWAFNMYAENASQSVQIAHTPITVWQTIIPEWIDENEFNPLLPDPWDYMNFVLRGENGADNRCIAGYISWGPSFNILLEGEIIPQSTVPIPGAVWLFASGIVGLAALRRKVQN